MTISKRWLSIPMGLAMICGMFFFTPAAFASNQTCDQGSHGKICIRWNSSTLRMESTFYNNSGGANTLVLLMRQRQGGSGPITVKSSGSVTVAAGDTYTMTYNPNACFSEAYAFFTRIDYADGTGATTGDVTSCSG
jgi:hypothetical protein